MSNASLERAQAISARASQGVGTGSTAVLPCAAPLHIGFFFDGFGRNLEEDLRNDRLSHIGRLFLAPPSDQSSPPPDPFRQLQKFYISGLGATLPGPSATSCSRPTSRAAPATRAWSWRWCSPGCSMPWIAACKAPCIFSCAASTGPPSAVPQVCHPIR